MTNTTNTDIAEIRDKVLKGTALAIEKLIERKRKEDSFIVVSHNGNVIHLKVSDIPTK